MTHEKREHTEKGGSAVGSVALVTKFGAVDVRSDSWPTSDYPIGEGYRVSYKGTVNRSPYEGAGFTMALRTAKAEVISTSESGRYYVNILGENVGDVRTLKDAAYRKLGITKVVFPVNLGLTSFFARMRWLLTGRLPGEERRVPESEAVK